jgi:hypothetical protein
MAMARDLRDLKERDSATIVIVEAQVNADDVTGALATARDLRDASNRSVASAFIARGQAKEGNTGAALASIASLPMFFRALALISVMPELPAR